MHAAWQTQTQTSTFLNTTTTATDMLILSSWCMPATDSRRAAAEILGIRKSELIDLYDKLGYSYFDMTMDELDDELDTFRRMKEKEVSV